MSDTEPDNCTLFSDDASILSLDLWSTQFVRITSQKPHAKLNEWLRTRDITIRIACNGGFLIDLPTSISLPYVHDGVQIYIADPLEPTPEEMENSPDPKAEAEERFLDHAIQASRVEAAQGPYKCLARICGLGERLEAKILRHDFMVKPSERLVSIVH